MRRFSANNDKYQWKKYLGNVSWDEEVILNKNIGIGETANILIGSQSTFISARWGFVSGSNKNSVLIPFAEAAQAHVLPSFRMAFRNQRGVLLADSFYGWTDQEKIPYRIKRKDKDPLLIAVLFRMFEDIFTFVILYKRASSELPFLKREPILLKTDQWRTWLKKMSVQKTLDFLNSQTYVPLETYTVSKKILIKGNNEPEVHIKKMNYPSLFP